MNRSVTSLAATAVLLLVCLIAAVPGAAAVKFELSALAPGTKEAKNHRCLSAYVGRNVLVRGTYDVTDGEHQLVDVVVSDSGTHRNQYYQRTNIDGPGKFAFTTLDHAEINVCFTNTLEHGFNPTPTMMRTISLSLDTGADAREDDTFQEKNEHLKPVEIELRRLENLMDEIVDEMEYLKAREKRMRSTNESTNERVLGFSLLSITTLVALGGWQVYYLRSFFQAKKLI
ncbi:vesicle coat component [Blastocladiella emersonii ATCC 22665]|nr:vesicle coat component [Blastocladiella emersonii ATCC 22665]